MHTSDDLNRTPLVAGLDVDGLLARCQGSASTLATLLDLCMGQVVKDTDTLRTAIKDCDPKGAMISAHNLRGLALLIGAERLGELAASIEDSGEAGDLPGIGQRSDQLEREVDRCMEMLRHLAHDLQRLEQPVEA